MAKTRKSRGGVPPDRFLTREQTTRLLQYVRGEAQRSNSQRAATNEIIIEVLLNSGLRAAELCALRMRECPHHHGKNVLYVEDGKGGVSRTVEIPGKLVAKLTSFIRTYRKNSRPGSAVVVSERGCRAIHSTIQRRSKMNKRKIVEHRTENSSRLTYRSLYSRVKILGEKAGFENLSPHRLRHTYLCLLYNVEQDLRFTQDQAGHANINTTSIYAATNNEARRRQIEAINL